MADFSLSMPALRSVEGGYVNDPDDLGGETYSGISRRNFPHWTGWALIDQEKSFPSFPKNLSTNSQLRTMVDEFYRVNFWNANSLSEVKSQETADEIFEMAVNIGNTPAVDIVQMALNLLNKYQKLYKNLVVDGRLGGVTLQAIQYHEANPKPLIRTINGLQFERYADICRKNEKMEKYFYGWLTRT